MSGNRDQAQDQVQGFTMKQMTAAINAAVAAAVQQMTVAQQEQQHQHKATMRGVTILKIELQPFAGEKED